MKDNDRQLAAWSAETLSRSYQPNMILVLVVNESETVDGKLEVDLAMHMAGSVSGRGAEMLHKFRDQLQAAVRKVAADVGGPDCLVEREGLAIHVTGERPKA